MKTPVLFLAAALAVSAVQTSAATMVEDADGNGTYSMDEMAVSYPDLTAEDFAEIDSDGSGEVDTQELALAIESGMLAN